MLGGGGEGMEGLCSSIHEIIIIHEEHPQAEIFSPVLEKHAELG